VKVVPGAHRDRIVGWLDGALKVAVAAPPEAGKANEAVTRLLGAALGTRVRLVRGGRSMRKTVEVEGLEEAVVRERVERALSRSGGSTPR
jgi:uncharacterized protein (TIGR00251 family)